MSLSYDIATGSEKGSIRHHSTKHTGVQRAHKSKQKCPQDPSLFRKFTEMQKLSTNGHHHPALSFYIFHQDK
eukprot:2587853-Amphidinium_carterae.1